MKNVSSSFKTNIKKYGKQLDCKIEVGELTIEKEFINNVVPSFNTSLFKSVMCGFEIDSNVIIPKGYTINIKIGIKFGTSNYEYIDFNGFEVYSCERQEDTESYKIVAYDKMLEAMVDFDLEINEKLTVREYLIRIFQRLGWVTTGIPTTFINSTKFIEPMIHYGIQYTFRDVLDELATITGSFILVEDSIPKLKYITETNETINEEYLSEDDVTIGDRYFINSLVFSRAEESDNIFRKNDSSIEQYGLHEFRITDNQILSTNNRDDFIDELFNYLKTLSFYIFDVKSTGIMWLDVADMFTFNIRNNNYKTILLNDEITIEQDIEEHLYTDEPGETETDYKYADSTDKKINQTYILVDKQNQKITQLANQNAEHEKKLAQIELDVDKITQKVENITDFTREITQINEIHLSDTVDLDKAILDFKIEGSTNNFIYLTPSNDLVPSDILVPLGGHFTLVCDKQSRANPSEKAVGYEIWLSEPLRNIDDVYDELRIINNKATVIRRIGVNDDLSLYLLDTETVEDLGEIKLKTFDKDTYIYIKQYTSLKYYCKYMADNDYIDIFATQGNLQETATELRSDFTQTVQEITAEVNKKVGEEEFGTQLSLNAEALKMAWNRISQYLQLEGLDGKASLVIYDKNNKKLTVYDDTGQHFYDGSDNAFGEMGVQTVDDEKYISFSVLGEYDSNIANGMAWGIKTKTDNKFFPILFIKNFHMANKDAGNFSGELQLNACDLVLNGEETGIKSTNVKMVGDVFGGFSFIDVSSGTTLFQISPRLIKPC